VTSAIRWLARLCVADVVLLVGMLVGLLLADVVGLNIQPLKWPTVSVAAILMFLLFVLSAVGVALQVAEFVRRRSKR
jgi:uncharacterized protein YacL